MPRLERLKVTVGSHHRLDVGRTRCRLEGPETEVRAGSRPDEPPGGGHGFGRLPWGQVSDVGISPNHAIG